MTNDELMQKTRAGTWCTSKEEILRKAIEKKLTICVRSEVIKMPNPLHRETFVLLLCSSYDIFFMSDEYEGLEEHWHYYEASAEDQEPWLVELMRDHPRIKLRVMTCEKEKEAVS